MQKEFLYTQLDWTVEECLLEIKEQAKDVEKVYTIYVVDALNKLIGVLSLKTLFFADPSQMISDLYQGKILFQLK